MFLFGTDYTDYKNFLTEGWVLYLKGKVQNRQWGDTDQLEFKVHKIEMLDQLIDSENRHLLIEVSFDVVNDNIVNKLMQTINNNKGEHLLKIKLINYQDKYAVDLLSRNTKVGLSKDFIDSLRKINDLKVSIES